MDESPDHAQPRVLDYAPPLRRRVHRTLHIWMLPMQWAICVGPQFTYDMDYNVQRFFVGIGGAWLPEILPVSGNAGWVVLYATCFVELLVVGWLMDRANVSLRVYGLNLIVTLTTLFILGWGRPLGRIGIAGSSELVGVGLLFNAWALQAIAAGYLAWFLLRWLWRHIDRKIVRP